MLLLQEYVVLLAMRHVDLKEGKARVTRLARRLWDSKALPHEYAPIRRPRIILGLIKWCVGQEQGEEGPGWLADAVMNDCG